MLTVDSACTIEELSPHLHAWEKLVRRSPEGDLFQSPDWVLSWLEAFWCDRPLAFRLVKEGDELRGLAPFVRDTTGSLQCRSSLALPVNANGPSGIIHDGDPEPIVDAVVASCLASENSLRMVLSSVRKDSSVIDVLPRVGRKHGCRSVARERGDFSLARLNGTWEDYLATRSRHFRRGLRRKEARAARAARVDLRVATEPDELHEAMKDVLAVEDRSWKQPRGLSIRAEPGRQDFYAALIRRSASRGRLRAYVLHFDDQPAAHIFGMVFKNEYYALTTGYDESFANLSPGAILFACALRDAFAQGYETFNFLGGEAGWKARMSNDARSHVSLCIFSDSFSRCAYCWAADGLVKPLVRKKLPGIVAAKNRWLGRR